MTTTIIMAIPMVMMSFWVDAKLIGEAVGAGVGAAAAALKAADAEDP